MLRKLELFLMPSKLDKMRETLIKKGVQGMSVVQAQGYGTRSKSRNGVPQFEERVKAEIVVADDILDDVIRSIKDLAGAGQVGAGMVFISPVEDAIRLSTRESGKSAIV
ncbi:MAG: P-II family nitrogen regulator [Planctomycetes bacterium]|nr:P-II family nitrogen regulator [Planctomycetota bacterium]